MEDGAAEIGLGEVGALEGGAGQVGKAEIGLDEADVAQHGVGEIGLQDEGVAHFGPAHVGALGAGRAELGGAFLEGQLLELAAFARLEHDAAPEIGLDKHRVVHPGAAQAGAPKVGPAQLGMLQIGRAQIGGKQVGVDQLGPGQLGAEQLGAREIGLGQIAAGEIQEGQIPQLQAGASAAGAVLEIRLMGIENAVEFGLGNLVAADFDLIDRGWCQIGGGHDDDQRCGREGESGARPSREPVQLLDYALLRHGMLSEFVPKANPQAHRYLSA